MNHLKSRLLIIHAVLLLASTAPAATVNLSFYVGPNRVTTPYAPALTSIWVYDGTGQKVTTASVSQFNFYGQNGSSSNVYGSLTANLPGPGQYSFSFPAQTGSGRWWTPLCTATAYQGGSLYLSPSSLPSPEGFPYGIPPLALLPAASVFASDIDINGNEIDFGSNPINPSVPAFAWVTDGNRLRSIGSVYSTASGAVNSSWTWELQTQFSGGSTTVMSLSNTGGLTVNGSSVLTGSSLAGTLLTNLSATKLSVGTGNNPAANSAAIGTSNTSSGSNSLAVGTGNGSSGPNSLAAGNLSTASGTNTGAFGLGTTAQGYNQFVLGQYNTLQGTGTANANATDALFIIGNGTGTAAASRSNALVVNRNGATTINGTLSVSGLFTALGGAGMAGGSASGPTSVAIGAGSNAAGLKAFAAGDQATALGEATIALGRYAYAQNRYSMALGGLAAGEGSTAIGPNSQAIAPYSVAVGSNSQASGSYSFAQGLDSLTQGEAAVAMGVSAFANGLGSIAFGYNVTADAPYQTAVGRINRSRDDANNILPGIFVIGNGTIGNGTTIPTVRSNAMRVLDDGTILIRKSGDLPMDGFDQGVQP